MNLEVRPIKLEQDYDLLSDWLKGHNKPVLDKGLYSDLGLMVSHGNIDLVAAFLFTTNSDICLIENFISNPKSLKFERREAINILIQKLVEKAKEFKSKLIFTSLDLNSLIQSFEKQEFKVLPTNKLYFRSL